MAAELDNNCIVTIFFTSDVEEDDEKQKTIQGKVKSREPRKHKSPRKEQPLIDLGDIDDGDCSMM